MTISRPERRHSITKQLFAPTDIASIVIFRIIFGAIMFWETLRYFSKGWISRYWVEPQYHFTYWPFDFIQPLPGNGMFILFGVLSILSVFIMIGFLYRTSIFLFFILFTYSFLLEQTRYLNHFYLVVLISFILLFIPAHRSYSVDSRLFPGIRSESVPAWNLWLIRFTIALPYFFGGVAKINGDWLRGEPMRSWLYGDTSIPLIGPLFNYDWMIYFMSYSGLLLDLLVVPLLLYKPTRKWTFIFAALFHLMNAQLFQIGIFPWFMLFATTIYFEPSWPRRFLPEVKTDKKARKNNLKKPWIPPPVLSTAQKLTLTALALWAAIHIFLPFRHLIIPGNVHWTEEGHKYAWHMKLRSKEAYGYFTVIDRKTGMQQTVNADEYLTGWQESKMWEWPELIWQFARKIQQDFAEQGKDVAVHASVMASLNGRAYQPLIDPSVDLAQAPRPGYPAASWIVPLKIPLSQKDDENEEVAIEE